MANDENLYRQIGRLIETMPDLTQPPTSNVNLWLGRMYAVIESASGFADQTTFKLQVSSLNSAARNHAAQEIYAIVYRAFGLAELKAPAGADGSFIPVGSSFDAFAAISKLLQSAARDVLIVDPFLDATVLTDFATAVHEKVSLRLLADKSEHKSSLIPAARRWTAQYGETRPLALRLAEPRMLHDRAIFIDGITAYTLTQSLNAFAKRSPAEIVRADDTAALKIAAYEEIWSHSQDTT
ncbi:MAG TPA: hypothetical protein VIE69_01760 [Methylophilaceae bacterium]|jgi:hypothetical protein